MREIIDYTIETGNTPQALATEVKLMMQIGRGWQPFGPRIALYWPEDNFYEHTQAMVRYAPEAENG